MTLGWITDTVTPDLSRALHYTLLWGLDGVVLRTVGGASERVPFVNERRLRERLEADQIPVLAIDPGVFEGSAQDRVGWMNEVEAFEEVAAFCQRIGVRCVRTGALASGPDSLDMRIVADALHRLGDAAERHGLHLAVRNERGTHLQTGAALAQLIHEVEHPAVRADWHPLDALQAGEAPDVGQRALEAAGTVASVTVQDEMPDGSPALIGEGRVGWDAVLRDLGALGWAGDVILEIRGRPVGTFGLRQSSAAHAAIRQATR